MNRKYMSIIIMSLALGGLIGMIIREDISERELYISKDSIAIEEIKSISENIELLEEEKKEVGEELERLKNENLVDIETNKLDSIRQKLSYTDVELSGVRIVVDAQDESVGNIANLIEYNKILINIINDLKVNGATNISINGERINQYSEIVLAGNHININATPIAPPYSIEASGDINDMLINYIEDSNSYINRLENQYPLKVSSNESNNIEFNQKQMSYELNLIEGDTDNIE